MTFMESIAKMEGFPLTGSRAYRNNNPGNVNFAPWTQDKFGAVIENHPAPRFAAFPDVETGWNALRHLLQRDYQGMTIQQALNRYAPPQENQTNTYISSVCKWMGVTPETVLTAENIG